MFSAGRVFLTHPAGVVIGNIIQNGTFASNTIWAGAGFSGKTISGGTANFVSSPTFNGFTQTIAPVGGKYYELTWTILSYSSGSVRPQTSGGAGSTGTIRSANGTYVERMLVGAGDNNFVFQLTVTGTLSVDNLTFIGPYNTSTVGGS
jgi:hypothetical protein